MKKIDLSFIRAKFLKNNGGFMSSDLPKVSIYLHKNEDAIDLRWTKLIKDVEEKLVKKIEKNKVHNYLKNLYDVEPHALITEKNAGIAFFHCQEFTGFVEVPKKIDDSFFISKSFHLKPIFSWLQSEFEFYLLGLSKNQIKLFKGGVTGLALVKKWSYSDNVEFEKKFDNWDNFFRRTENELDKIFSQDRTPVVLAGLKEHISFYKKINKDPDLVMMSITGSINGKSIEELNLHAKSILNDIFESNKKTIINQFKELKTIKKATDELTLVVQNALKGKIKILGIAEDRYLWGKIDVKEGSIDLSREGAEFFNDDLLDDLAELVLAKGGKIISLKQMEMPTKNPIFAILN